jgi:DNA-binding response OmpR family regulator
MRVWASPCRCTRRGTRLALSEVSMSDISTARANPTMLVVDDERAILLAIKSYFSHHGYSVDCAQELEEAEALMANLHYDVVIADLRLTGFHGTEGLEIVRSVRERYPRTSVILLTAYGSPEIEEVATRYGVSSFLQKPKPLAELAQVVFGVVGNA